jgi:hypothetical protein
MDTLHFSHRHNVDGTIDSICHCCFRTVGTTFQEADLKTQEDHRRCLPEHLMRFQSHSEELSENLTTPGAEIARSLRE